jgi:hypothetical protein
VSGWWREKATNTESEAHVSWRHTQQEDVTGRRGAGLYGSSVGGTQASGTRLTSHRVVTGGRVEEPRMGGVWSSEPASDA